MTRTPRPTVAARLTYRGRPARAGGIQLAFVSADSAKVVRDTDGDGRTYRAKGRWLFVKLRVTAVGPRPIDLRRLTGPGTRLRTGTVIHRSQYTVAGPLRAPQTTDLRVAPGQQKTVVLSFDVDPGRLDGAVLEFGAGASRTGRLRLPPLRASRGARA